VVELEQLVAILDKVTTVEERLVIDAKPTTAHRSTSW